MGQCGAPMMGGKRKTRKGKKTTRKLKGGVMYGPTQAITPGALQWGAVDTSAPYSSASGQPIADPFKTSGDTNAKVTGGRRRKSRKGKSKKAGKKSRKMKGGAWSPGNVNAAGVGYGFSGTTSGVTGGIAPATAYPSGVGGAPMGADGVRQA